MSEIHDIVEDEVKGEYGLRVTFADIYEGLPPLNARTARRAA